LDWPWEFMCEPSGGCHYTYTETSTGPYDDNSIWCTYKTQIPWGPRDPPSGNGNVSEGMHSSDDSTFSND
jgi:hypothetical protein